MPVSDEGCLRDVVGRRRVWTPAIALALGVALGACGVIDPDPICSGRTPYRESSGECVECIENAHCRDDEVCRGNRCVEVTLPRADGGM